MSDLRLFRDADPAYLERIDFGRRCRSPRWTKSRRRKPMIPQSRSKKPS